MFITENQNLADSVMFLLSARQTLADIVEASGSDNAAKMVQFLHNEASDYEVMNLLITGKMPDEKYNPAAESQLFSIFKEQMLRDHEKVTEAIGNTVYQNVLHEVDSVYPIMSTATPILEFMAAQDIELALACYVSEVDTGPIVMPTAKKVSAGWRNVRNISRPTTFRNVRAAQTPAPTLLQKGVTAVKGAAAGAKAIAIKGLAALKTFALSPAGQVVGGAAMAALIGYAAVKTYKRFFSQAAKACAKLPTAGKTACMAKYKKQAIMKQAADLQKGASICSRVKNPEKCKAGVAKKLASLKAKAGNIAA